MKRYYVILFYRGSVVDVLEFDSREAMARSYTSFEEALAKKEKEPLLHWFLEMDEVQIFVKSPASGALP